MLIFVYNENDARLLTKLSLFVPRVSASTIHTLFFHCVSVCTPVRPRCPSGAAKDHFSRDTG